MVIYCTQTTIRTYAEGPQAVTAYDVNGDGATISLLICVSML